MASWQTDARKAALRFGIDPSWFIRQMGQEAHGADLTSGAGAQGPAQFMPGTARSVGLTPVTVHQRVPAYNAAAKLMAGYVKQYGSVKNALVAYNAGPGRVGGALPAETQNYIRTILNGSTPRGTVNAPTVRRSAPSGMDPLASLGAPAGASISPDPGGGVDVSALLSALQGQRRAPAPSTLQAPSFAAGPVMPAGYQALASGSGPAPKTDVGSLLALVRTQGGGDTTGTASLGGAASVSGAEAPVTASRPSRGSRTPTGRVVVAKGANRPGANLNPAVTQFVSRVAGLYGQPLTIGTGTAHNRLTINGTVSDHWSGNGADVPLTGRALIRAGQDALIEAGMPPAKARRQTGGGYNVGGWQVIFNTDAPGWGNHLTHLHIGRRSR